VKLDHSSVQTILVVFAELARCDLDLTSCLVLKGGISLFISHII